jgi:acyl-CoA thioesterase-1
LSCPTQALTPERARRLALLWASRAALALALMPGGAQAVTNTTEHPKPATAPLLVLGDSLSAEYGLARGTGWVALMEARMRSQGATQPVVNASISGETTAGGLSRLPALLKAHRPATVVIELGANDALRGLSLKVTQDNLSRLVSLAQAERAQVVLVGMQMPPNFGQRHAEKFAALFGAVAQQHKVPLVPFMLAGVADRPDARDWFQADGIHPLAKAHPVILDRNLWPVLQPLLTGRTKARLSSARAGA